MLSASTRSADYLGDIVALLSPFTLPAVGSDLVNGAPARGLVGGSVVKIDGPFQFHIGAGVDPRTAGEIGRELGDAFGERIDIELGRRRLIEKGLSGTSALG